MRMPRYICTITRAELFERIGLGSWGKNENIECLEVHWIDKLTARINRIQANACAKNARTKNEPL